MGAMGGALGFSQLVMRKKEINKKRKSGLKLTTACLVVLFRFWVIFIKPCNNLK
jgi:hypothetical protein